MRTAGFESVLFVLLVLTTDIMGQQSGWQWARSVSSDGGNYAMRSAADGAGNVYVSGYFGNDTIYFGSDTLFHSDNYGGDVFLVKYDGAGNVIWARNFPSGRNFPNSDDDHDLVCDANGNVYFTVILGLDTAVYGAFTLVNANADTVSWTNLDVITVKCDSSGNVVWAKCMGGTRSDFSQGLCVDDNNNVYLTGHFLSDTLLFAGDTLYCQSNLGHEVFMVKYDSLGNETWARQGIGNLEDIGRSIDTDANGNIYVTGFFNSDGIQFGSIMLNNLNIGIFQFFMVKYDSNGNALWARKANSADDNRGYDVAVDNAGNILATGAFKGASITFGSVFISNTAATGYYDVLVVKYDPSGNVIWAKGDGSTDGDLGYSICVTANNAVLVTGRYGLSYAVFGNDTCMNAGTLGTGDAFIVKYDVNGNELWLRSANGNGDDQGNSICVNTAGDVFITGFYWINLTVGSFTLTNPGNGGSEMFLAKLGATTGIAEQDETNELLVYPNPVTDVVQVQATDAFTLLLYNAAGTLILELNSTTGNINVDMSGYLPGVYFLMLKSKEQQQVRKIVKS